MFSVKCKVRNEQINGISVIIIIENKKFLGLTYSNIEKFYGIVNG